MDLERWFSLRQSNRLNSLATYPVPKPLIRLRSFIGAYKVLSSVIRRCSSYFALLDAVTADRPTLDFINWTDDLGAAFRSAQNALSSALTIALPRPGDQLWIVNDEAVRDPLCDRRRQVTCAWFLQLPSFYASILSFYGNPNTCQW